MKIHNIEDSLNVEKSNFQAQDNFYMKHFGNMPNRVDYSEDPETQRKDIDLYIKNNSGRMFSVSEKFRPYDYNDVLFEVFSVYSDKLGWAVESQADLLCYFMPNSVVMLDMCQMKEILVSNSITKQIGYIDYQIKNKDIVINNDTYFVKVIKALNKSYFSLSIAFEIGQLRRLGVRHNVFFAA